MVEINQILPVGSVVLLKNGIKKVMIVGILQNIRRESEVIDNYDYIGVIYPEGYLGQESMMLFNHEQINDVIFRGYDNPEREEFVAYIERELSKGDKEKSLQAPSADL